MNTEKYNELVNRLETLETRQAFQEDTIESLNTVIIKQKKDTELLELKIDALLERIKHATDNQSDFQQEEPPPPHY